jgi:hypothetical protein
MCPTYDDHRREKSEVLSQRKTSAHDSNDFKNESQHIGGDIIPLSTNTTDIGGLKVRTSNVWVDRQQYALRRAAKIKKIRHLC